MSHVTLIYLRKRRVTPLDAVLANYINFRAAVVRYPVLKTLLINIYRARRSHNAIRDIEFGLFERSITSFKKI